MFLKYKCCWRKYSCCGWVKTGVRTRVIHSKYLVVWLLFCYRYTYGKPVRGLVTINICRKYSRYSSTCHGEYSQNICEEFSQQVYGNHSSQDTNSFHFLVADNTTENKIQCNMVVFEIVTEEKCGARETWQDCLAMPGAHLRVGLMGLEGSLFGQCYHFLLTASDMPGIWAWKDAEVSEVSVYQMDTRRKTWQRVRIWLVGEPNDTLWDRTCLRKLKPAPGWGEEDQEGW